jgi:hypothetical protein
MRFFPWVILLFQQKFERVQRFRGDFGAFRAKKGAVGRPIDQ